MVGGGEAEGWRGGANKSAGFKKNASKLNETQTLEPGLETE